MKFFQYLESRYVELNIDLQVNYDLNKHAASQATQDLINAQRKVFKWINYPVLIVKFFLIKLSIINAPESAQEIMARLQEKAKQASKPTLVQDETKGL